VVTARDEDAQEQSPVWCFRVVLQPEAYTALVSDLVAEGGVPGMEVELQVVQVPKDTYPTLDAAKQHVQQQVQGMYGHVQTTADFTDLYKHLKGLTSDQQLWESLLVRTA
jgi:hypothetical protein